MNEVPLIMVLSCLCGSKIEIKKGRSATEWAEGFFIKITNLGGEGEAGDRLKRVVCFVKIKVTPTIVRNLRIIWSEFTFAYSYLILQQQEKNQENKIILLKLIHQFMLSFIQSWRFNSKSIFELYKFFLPILSKGISKQRDTYGCTGPIRIELCPKITYQI